jgi:NlpC/P60 family putative phage cell wall peptidase
MSKIDQFIAEVRTWIDTPFMHAGRVKGIGVDCVGILACSARTVGLMDYDNVNYSPASVDSEFLISELQRFTDPVPPEQRQPGDVLLFRVKGRPQHTGVLVTPSTFIHAYQSAGKVCESELNAVWLRNLAGVYRIKAELCS